ncbi:MAG: hypothetical protein HRT55_13320 [Colwellia sp.]|uniref:hypothetical protein n=1 Tax=Colwellia sp. TaxID=56799 RepID=UPI0025C547E0|nr:hypothetical protein [Colwellia sp.]NQZ27281.1 hypothetical protein [Colwellia sp.]
MNIIRTLFIFLLLAMTSACSSYNTYSSGQMTTEPVSYLYFTGNITNAEVSIDGAPAFLVTKAGPKQQYKVTPGKHTIIVTKRGQVVVQRDVLLGDDHEKEINIPQ